MSFPGSGLEAAYRNNIETVNNIFEGHLKFKIQNFKFKFSNVFLGLGLEYWVGGLFGIGILGVEEGDFCFYFCLEFFVNICF